jgi:hypothetical protein
MPSPGNCAIAPICPRRSGPKAQDTQTPLFAVESRRSLVDFDILGFSLSYELGATNILVMLDPGGHSPHLAGTERDPPAQR